MSIIRTRDRSDQSQYNNFRLRPVSVVDAWPAAPEYIAVTGTASTSTASVGWPTGTLPGDFALLVFETSGDEAANPPSDWTQIGSPVIDVADATGSTLTVYYRLAPEDLPSTSIPAATDHKVASIAVFRGVSASAAISPVTDTKTTASTSLTFPDYTVAAPNSLVVFIATHPSDTSTAQFSNLINGNLTSITERRDFGTANGNGGGHCIYTGVASNPGSIGTSTLTVATSVTNACMILALEPSLAYPA